MNEMLVQSQGTRTSRKKKTHTCACTHTHTHTHPNLKHPLAKFPDSIEANNV